MDKIRQPIGANRRQWRFRKQKFACCCNNASAGTADYRRYTFVSVPTYRLRSDTLVPDAFVHALDRRFGMSMLYAVCPRDGSRIETGVFADRPTCALFFDHRILIRCERCAEYHSTRVEELLAEQDGVFYDAA
jgi:hypothetical protein